MNLWKKIKNSAINSISTFEHQHMRYLEDLEQKMRDMNESELDDYLYHEYAYVQELAQKELERRKTQQPII